MIPHNLDVPLYSIGTAARILKVSVQTLRMYESEGLVTPYKTLGNQRLYSNADIERIECIRKAINEEKISIAGIRRMHAMIPCWDILKCSIEERTACAAFHNHSGGCWTFKHEHSVCAAKECRLCSVYKLSSNCEHIKEQIVKLTAARDTNIQHNDNETIHHSSNSTISSGSFLHHTHNEKNF